MNSRIGTVERPAALELPPHDEAAENEVLGAILLTSTALGVVAEAGLRSEHFYSLANQRMFAAMAELHREGTEITHITLAAKLPESDHRRIATLFVESTTNPGAILSHARIVVDKAAWRQRREAAQIIHGAVAEESEDGIAVAETLLAQAAEGSSVGDSFAPGALAEEMYEYLQEGGIEAFPFPFRRLNDLAAGGMRRGGLTLVGGHTSHGKSALIDQILDHLSTTTTRAGETPRCWLYINEMDHLERTARTLARRTGFPHDWIQTGGLSPEALGKVVAELGRLPFGITKAFGWSATDIARHARHHRFDVIAVDGLHGIPYPDGMSRAEGLGSVSRELKRLAGTANCHVLSAVWLNEARVVGAVRPQPTLGDIRDSGQPKNDADNVLYVWQEQDVDTGAPTGEGVLYFAKCRGGRLGGLNADFSGRSLQFLERVVA